MKRNFAQILAFILAVAALLTLCSCGNTDSENTSASAKAESEDVDSASEETAAEAGDERAANGYFRILHTKKTDAWGDIVEEGPEYIVAIAEAYGKDGQYVGEVSLYFNYKEFPYRDYSPHNFYFRIPVSGKKNAYEVVRRVDFKIGDEKDYFVCGEENYVSEDDASGAYNFLISKFANGEDIVFNFSGVHTYIFTIHGEGFADLIEKVAESEVASVTPAEAAAEAPAEAAAEAPAEAAAETPAEAAASLEKEYVYFSMDSYDFIDAYNQSENALGTLNKESDTMRVKGTNIDVLFFVWDVSESALPLGSWAIPETDFNAMMIRLVSNGSDQCDNNGLTAITLIAQSFAEIFDPTFDCNDFVKNSTSSYIGEYVTLTYSHNGFEYKLEGSPSTVGSLKSYYYDFTISLSANKD